MTKYITIAMNRVALLITTMFAVISVGGSSAHADDHSNTAPVVNTITQDELKEWVTVAMADMRATEPGPEVSWADTYETTAEKIAEAAVANPLLNDPLHTAATMVVIGWHESRFRPDVVGDHGASFGLFQVNSWTARDVGCSKDDLLDPDKASECALKLLHVSFGVCHRHPLDERLAQYAYGHDCEHRLELSRHRMHAAAKLVKKHPLVHVAQVAEVPLPTLGLMTGDPVPGDVRH